MITHAVIAFAPSPLEAQLAYCGGVMLELQYEAG